MNNIPATTITNTDITKHFNEIRNYSEHLCQPLITEDYIPQPVVFVSPPKWHLGHTSWFFEDFILKKYLSGYRVFDDQYAFLFNSYYNTVGERVQRANRGNLTRPSVEEVYSYRRYVDKHMRKLLTNANSDICALVVLGLNHEQQHQELFLTDLKFILSNNPLYPVYQHGYDLTKTQNAENGFLAVQEGVYDVGYEGAGFCYDNELARHKVFAHAFEISKSLVTNGEYMDFIQDGGYNRFELWLDEGWAWVKENNISAPAYWHLVDGQWQMFTLAGMKPVVDEEVLCHISYYEAAAFALWKSMRLPTEIEWEIAATHLPAQEVINWGQRWEWTSSPYVPYPGFEIAEGAVGEYNGKFMINQMVLRGASSATSPNHSRSTYRNFFHPIYRWQYTGIRLAKKQKL